MIIGMLMLGIETVVATDVKERRLQQQLVARSMFLRRTDMLWNDKTWYGMRK